MAFLLQCISQGGPWQVFRTVTGQECQSVTSESLAGHGEICPPTWVIHMATRRPAHSMLIHMDCLYGFLCKNAPNPCGSACCGLVCGSPCGSPKFHHGLLEKSLIQGFPKGGSSVPSGVYHPGVLTGTRECQPPSLLFMISSSS